MKYTKGTPTLLGEITLIDEKDRTFPYSVKIRDGFYLWLSESEIDAIVIKPKRNIDHLIELWDGCKSDKACRFMYDNIEWNKRTLYNVMFELFQPYIEPRKYPVLTPEELKAVKWLVDGGFTHLKRLNGIWEIAESEETYLYLTSFMLTAKCLRDAKWITETPINLKELLEAQEDV